MNNRIILLIVVAVLVWIPSVRQGDHLDNNCTDLSQIPDDDTAPTGGAKISLSFH